MAFDSITTAEIAVDRPITNELLTKFVNRDNYLNGQVGTLQAFAVSNPSFEVDSDGDGQPDNWETSFFTGGTGALNTSTAIHGANSYKFTHPGGAGNGGGRIDSDFFDASTMAAYVFNGKMKSDTNLNNAVIIRAYDANKSTLAETTLWRRKSTVATWQDIGNMVFSLPSSSRYFKVRLEGGATVVSSAGEVHFDNIGVAPSHYFAAASSDANLMTFTRSAYGSTGIVHAFNSPYAGRYHVNFSATSSAGTTFTILKNGSVVATKVVSSASTPTTYSITDVQANDTFTVNKNHTGPILATWTLNFQGEYLGLHAPNPTMSSAMNNNTSTGLGRAFRRWGT